MYINTGSSVPGVPSKSRDLAEKNNKILTEWKRFETTVLEQFSKMRITLFGCKFVIEKKKTYVVICFIYPSEINHMRH